MLEINGRHVKDVPVMDNAFTVDVEDYFQVAAFEEIVAVTDWERFSCRVDANTDRILTILEVAEVKATFFILGWVAERYPALVGRIAAAGHEIASHGYTHQLIYRQTEAEFREDVRRARGLLGDLIGRRIAGFRAPSWSITPRTPWAHRVLIEEGHTYDSSVFPIKHDLHGTPDAPRGIHRIETSVGSILEFPPSVVTWWGRNIPTGGGGFFRLYPYMLTRTMLRAINRAGRPFAFYVHPWEIDPDQPRITGASWKSRFRHYVNLGRTAVKLEKLLNDFSFRPMGELLDAIDLMTLPIRQIAEQDAAS